MNLRLFVEVASWNHHPNMKICNENLVGDEYYLLIPCSAYKVIHEKYDDLLNEHDNVRGHTQIFTEKSVHMCVHYFHIESF